MVRHLSWQARKNNSGCKASLIEPELVRLGCKSVLDIGCNAGEVARRVSKDRFVVGIDGKLDTRGFDDPSLGVALGKVRFSLELAPRLPHFDAALLLSVHHQWYASYGKDAAHSLVLSVLEVARKAVFVEFSALNSKYASDMGFIDNDRDSVLEFACDFLGQFPPVARVAYLGACPEFTTKEPFRFLFMAEVKADSERAVE